MSERNKTQDKDAVADGSDAAKFTESVISEAAASAGPAASAEAAATAGDGAAQGSVEQEALPGIETGQDGDARVAQLQGELEAERGRYADLFDKYQRSAAEFQNARRRLEKQMVEAQERAGEGVIKRLLPVLDDFDLAFEKLPAQLTDEEMAWVEGFRQIQRKLLDVLKDQGVTPIDNSGAFDPNLHEAVTSEPHDDVESGHIIATLRAGYASNGRVLRPALVRVAA
jgi:molecular chaperone GrpE